MSYILDALRKADAERTRDAAQVPDLYAQADAGPQGAHTSRLGWKWWWWALIWLVLAWVAWLWLGVARVEPPRPTVTGTAPAPLALPSPPAAVPPPAVDVHAQSTTPAATPSALTKEAAHAAAPAVAAATAARPAAATLDTSAAGPPPLPTLAELPADLRAQLPALAVGGAVYSAAAAGRLVILNGQVFREGDQPAEGLTVVQIGLKSTRLDFRGMPFEIMH